MHVQADRGRCVGSGSCAWTAPDVFAQDDEGLVVVVRERPGGELHRAARDAMELCPVQAVSARDVEFGEV